MEITTIIYLIIAFIAGAFLTFLYKRGKGEKADSAIELSDLEVENKQLKAKLASVEKEVSNKLNDETEKVEDIKTKYESLLKEANLQCKKLDEQLKDAINGNIDAAVKDQLADAEKLKKKIKDLEEEIEENEDDLSELKKKLRNKDTDISDLQDSLSKEQKVSKELREEVASAKQLLDEKVKELNMKVGSLDFIQELLSAKEISTEDTRKLNKKIDFVESFVKGQFTDLSSYLFTEYNLSWNGTNGSKGIENKKKHFYNAFDQWASTKRKSWLDGKTTIAFVGEFSAGKTSIVNRILSQDDPNIPQLPVSTKATTAIPTYIAGGSAVSYSFISGDAKRKVILEDTFKKVSKDILNQIKGVSSLIKYFVMTYNNPNLEGLSILDTPGFNSNDSEDRERTIEVINECDALFWVFDVNAGTVNRSSIEIIKEKLNKPLYVVINKVDTKAASEVEKVEKLIKKTLADAGLNVQQYIRFSSNAPLDSIMQPIKEVDKDDARDSFISDIRSDIEKNKEKFNQKVKTAEKEFNKSRRAGDKLTDDFINCLRELQECCNEAAGIPHWETHLFSSDRYEMSAEEGSRLKDLLDYITDNSVNEVSQKFDDRVNSAMESQQLWEELGNLKTAWQKINECSEQLKKISKDI